MSRIFLTKVRSEICNYNFFLNVPEMDGFQEDNFILVSVKKCQFLTLINFDLLFVEFYKYLR